MDKLPCHLYPAFDWTNAAGELDELANLQDAELHSYAVASASNWDNHHAVDDHCPVTVPEIEELAHWLALHGPVAG